MISIVKALYQQYFSIPSYNVLIIGLQQTGKTRFFNIIKNFNSLSSKINLSVAYNATVGLNTTKFDTNDIKLCLWDLGGKKSIRKIWENYYSQSHGIIFFFDDKNSTRFDQSLRILKQVLRHNQMARIPIKILCKKSQSAQKIQIFIKNEQQLFSRQYTIEPFIFEQIGVLGDPQSAILKQKQSIIEILKWMYKKTSQLDKEIKKY